ncbi:endolytic transglycosylase MltG [Anaerobranca gottschalkii]|uniref:Endolytic murein transglycosylase n=1 Tax=Anaerobranca gottschalkii DSM 13577 TaxID=1120990 RepID=A0A1H9Y4S6_9FIRM|nr:endolytic transglycosylase MltG [Anaerobranca gottschalkii]SES63789.1 UPF0755 protein [Anaerobranca gottschalkii DSM 13577]
MTLNLEKSKVFRLLAIAASVLLVLIIILSIALYILTLPPGKGENNVEIVIPIGTSPAAIAEILEDHGVIKNSLLYRLYLRRYNYSSRLQAGIYQLNDGLSYRELTEILLEGKLKKPTVRFTIPEGLKIQQIATRLENQGLINKDEFLDLIQNGEFDYWFIQGIPDNVDYRLEGYLFPDTYEVFEDSSEWEIINIMLRNFERNFPEEYRKRAEELGMSVHQVVTLASIVEREAMVDKERPIIAGVFHNRLKINMALQSCATVFYFTEREPVLISDTKIVNPYNTYVFPGLPPGPIGAPGRNAIHSTLFYEETDYLYFVTKKDGSGEHYFARTYEEHLANIAKSNRN